LWSSKLQQEQVQLSIKKPEQPRWLELKNLKMKKVITCLALIVSLGFISELSAKRIVEVYKSNGFFGLYNYTRSTFEGVDQYGNYHYKLVCFDPGTTRCRLTHAPFRVAPTTIDQEIEELENGFIEQTIVQIGEDNPSGEVTKKYQSTLSYGTIIWTYVEINWEQDPSNPDNTVYHTTVWSIKI
jgi:hypothetical protein